MTVLIHPAHYRHRCEEGCYGCYYCEGGLFYCRRCKGAEGSLPTDCPGRPLTPEEDADVLRGILDYDRRNGWTYKVSGRG